MADKDKKSNGLLKRAATTARALPAPGIDIVLLLTVIAMVTFGLLMVYSSSFIYAQEKTGDGFAFIKKQLIYAVLGFGALVSVCRVDYRRWAKWAYPALGVSIVMLAMVFIPGLGSRVLGAQRWLRLGPLTFQPGELAKFAVIIFVARQLDLKQERVHTLAAGVLAQFIVPLPALLLLLLQPDFGTTVMITIVIFALMFLAGVPKRYLASALLLAVTVGLFLAVGSAYRRQRLMTYLDPWRDPGGKGFQILQSLVGLHNGRIWGVGLGNGKEKLFYLPEAHNDFIFSVIGEELGFLGIGAVILAYLVFVYRGLRIAFNVQKQHQDNFGMLLAAGITLALGLQGFVNMSVVLGLLPTKGLTLPFISYGGSALLVDLIAVGILLSVARGPRSVRLEDTTFFAKKRREAAAFAKDAHG
jgi:cell division protein FtsW